MNSLFKRIIHITLAVILLVQYLASGLVSHLLWPDGRETLLSLWVSGIIKSNEMKVFAQSNSNAWLTKTSKSITGAWWYPISYNVTFTPTDSQRKTWTPTDGFQIQDSWSTWLCDLEVREGATTKDRDDYSNSCDPWDWTLVFTWYLIETWTLNNSNQNQWNTKTPLVIAEWSVASSDKIYAHSDWPNKITILHVAWDEANEFSYDFTNPPSTLPQLNNGNSAIPAWWNHLANKYSYSTTPAAPTSCDNITTSKTSSFTFSPTVDQQDTCNIVDIERSDWWKEYTYVDLSNNPLWSNNNNDRQRMCIDGSCTPVTYRYPFLMKDGTTPQEALWGDYYDYNTHTISINDWSSKVVDAKSKRWNPSTVWLWDQINGQYYVVRWNSDWITLYPAEAYWNLSNACKIAGTVWSDKVLVWFDPDWKYNWNPYRIYNNNNCSGISIDAWTISNWFNPAYIWWWDFCIEIEKELNDTCNTEIKLYMAPKTYEATIEATIGSGTIFTGCMVTNTVWWGSLSSMPEVTARTNIEWDECAAWAINFEKTVSWGMTSGFPVGTGSSGFTFLLSVTNGGKKGDKNTQEITIKDILSATWPVAWNTKWTIDLSGNNECEFKSTPSLTTDPVTAILKEWIKPWTTCTIAIPALFTGYGCYENKATAKQAWTTIKPLEGKARVCSTGMKLTLMKELVSSTSGEATFKLTIKNVGQWPFPVGWIIDIDDIFTTWLAYVDGSATSNDGCFIARWTSNTASLSFKATTTRELAPWSPSPSTNSSCSFTAKFTLSGSSTQTNTGCITKITPDLGSNTPQSCSSASVSGAAMSGSCVVSGSVTSGSVNATCTVTPAWWATVTSVAITALWQSISGSTSPFIAAFTVSTGSTWWNSSNVSLWCAFVLSNGFSGSCASSISNPTQTGTSNPSTPWWWGGWSPPKEGQSQWSKWWWQPKECKGGECKKKESQASNFGPGATVPYSAGIVNNDPNVAMEWIQFRDELPAGMAMYEWTATIDGQVVKQGNKNGARGRVELTPDLVGVVIPPLKTLNINYVTKIDENVNFGKFVAPGANLYECDDNGNKVPTSGNSNPNPNNNSSPQSPQNKCGWWAANAPASSNNFQPQSVSLPWPGTGSNSGTVSTGWNYDSLRCEPKLYDIMLSKKVITEKLEVGKSIKFEVTIKNEWLRMVTGLVVQDMFSGIVIKPPFIVSWWSGSSWSTTTVSASTLGIPQGYFSTANTGMFNLMSWGSLSGGQSVTIIIDAILSGTRFENKIQACNYKDILDPDSDACNGFDKGEDDESTVSWGVDVAMLWDRLWFDVEWDGLQTTWDKGIGDILTQLVTCGTDVVLQTGRTTSDGGYTFANIPPGKYAVRFEISWLKWFTISPRNVWTDDSRDSDGEKIDGKYAVTECITLSWGQSYLGHDLGMMIDFKNLTGVTYLSLAKTLVSVVSWLSVGQELIFKLTVTNDGILWTSWVSIKDKFVGLTWLKVGTSENNLKAFPTTTNDLIIYSGITVGGKPGWLWANPCTGANCPTTYGPTWSNQFIIYVAATLTSGSFSNYAQLCTYDVTKEWARPPIPNNIPCDNSINQPDDDSVSGWVWFGMLWDLVWNDADKNGLQNTGEVWIPGIDLELYSCTNTGSLIKKTKSASDGSYKFDALPAGSYSIKTLLITPNDKYTFVQGMMGSDRTKDSNIKTLSWTTIGWTDCVTVGNWSNDTSVDIGLNMNATDLQVTKTTVNPYVTSGDIITFIIELKNIWWGIIKKYNLKDTLPTGMVFDGLNTTDKIMLSHWMSGSVTGAANLLQTVCGYPANGWTITSNSISWYVPSSSIASNIWYNQSCVYKVKARVVSNLVGQMTNTVTIYDVNDETVTTNNIASALINAQPACDKITLNTSYGDAPLNVTYSVNDQGWYVRLLNANQQTLSNTQLWLSGTQTFTNPGYYYIEYVSPTAASGTKCLRPVVVKELSDCTSLTVVPSNETQYAVTCAWNYVTSYKIDLFKGTGNNKQLVSTINASNGQITLPDSSPYTVQCTINETVSYALDKIWAYTNPTTNQFQCPYKVRSDGRMCAVDTLVAPMKVSTFDMNALAQLPDPLEYCTSSEVSSAICVNGPVSSILVKNPMSCTKEVVRAQPDLLVTKSADKSSFAQWEMINWNITIRNIGGGGAKWITITDTIPSSLRVDWYTDIAPGTVTTASPNNTITWSLPDKVINPNQEFSFKVVTKLLSADFDQLKNTVSVGVLNGSESTLNNNTAEHIISKQGNSSIGDLIWMDTNKNGIQENGENGVRDLQVQLIWCTSVSPLYTTFTNAQGNYAFNQIGAWSYRILVQLPDKYRVSPRNAASPTTDSNIDPLTNMSDCFTLTNGQIKTDIDGWVFIDPSIPPQNTNCGNSQIQPEYGEQCDNNAVATDSVCQNCQIIKKSMSICGNGLMEQGEDCEINNIPNGKTCYNCKLTENSVCGDGKVSGYEECDTATAPKDGFQCIGCIFIPNTLATCGNGKQEIGEACDLWSANGSTQLIPSWVHAGKQCTQSCNVINTIGDIVLTYEPPTCTEIDPPSSMEGEYFPFRRDIDDTNVVSSCTKDGQILRESMSCVFDLYAGKWWTLSPLKTFATPCYNVSNFDWALLSTFNSLAADKYGKSQIMLDSSLIAGIYGEYKLRLKKIDYKVCAGTGNTNGWVVPYNTFNDSYDETICEYNFTVTRPYLMQLGSLISSNATDSLFNFYGFSSNEWSNNILSKYGVILEKIGLENYAWSTNLNYLIDEFVNKYATLSVESVTLGANTYKVPGKEIYVYRNGLTVDAASFDTSKPKTIIVEKGDLKINWSLAGNTLFVVPNGNIVIGTNNCNETQRIDGVFLTKNSIVSDKNYINNNLSSSWCNKGNIEIRWLLVGQWLPAFVSSRRSVLDNWFLNGNKKQAVLQWASVLITSNDQLFTVGIPGLDEFSKELTTYKK